MLILHALNITTPSKALAMWVWDLSGVQRACFEALLWGRRLQRMSAESKAASPASPPRQGQAPRLPDSPFTNSGEPGAEHTSGALVQLQSADSRGLEGRASSDAETAALAGRGSGDAEAAPASAVQPRRRELRSMSLRPAQQGAGSSEPSATASALEASLPTHLT